MAGGSILSAFVMHLRLCVQYHVFYSVSTHFLLFPWEKRSHSSGWAVPDHHIVQEKRRVSLNVRTQSTVTVRAVVPRVHPLCVVLPGDELDVLVLLM